MLIGCYVSDEDPDWMKVFQVSGREGREREQGITESRRGEEGEERRGGERRRGERREGTGYYREQERRRRKERREERTLQPWRYVEGETLTLTH